LLIFLRTNVIFCTKTSLLSYGCSNSHRAAPYEEFFSWGSRHQCLMEVGTYVMWSLLHGDLGVTWFVFADRSEIVCIKVNMNLSDTIVDA